MEKHFIRTTDEHTKNELLAMGFPLISSYDGYYTFLNDGAHLEFSDIKKCSLTNTLCV